MSFFRLQVMAYLFFLSGCLSTPKHSEQLVINLQASSEINKNSANESAPLQLFIYKVNNTDNFNALTARDLMTFTPSDNNENYQRLTDTIIQPGQSKAISVALEPAGMTVGIIAAYRELDSSRWSAVTCIPNPPPAHWFRLFRHPTPTLDVRLEKSRVVILARTRE